MMAKARHTGLERLARLVCAFSLGNVTLLRKEFDLSHDMNAPTKHKLNKLVGKQYNDADRELPTAPKRSWSTVARWARARVSSVQTKIRLETRCEGFSTEIFQQVFRAWNAAPYM